MGVDAEAAKPGAQARPLRFEDALARRHQSVARDVLAHQQTATRPLSDQIVADEHPVFATPAERTELRLGGGLRIEGGASRGSKGVFEGRRPSPTVDGRSCDD